MVMNIQIPIFVSGFSTTLPDRLISIFHNSPFATLPDSRNFHLNRYCYRLRSLLLVLPALLLKYSRATKPSSQDGR